MKVYVLLAFPDSDTTELVSVHRSNLGAISRRGAEKNNNYDVDYEIIEMELLE